MTHLQVRVLEEPELSVGALLMDLQAAIEQGKTLLWVMKVGDSVE